MTKESRMMVRLVALWIVFIFSLGLAFWSVQHLTMAIVKTKLGGYETYYSNAGSYAGGYNSYCLQQPAYPSLSSPVGMGMPPLAKEDQDAMDKYNKEMEKYNKEVSTLCKEDLEKQKNYQEAQDKSASVSDMATYSILSLFSICVAIITLMVIKRDEQA
ncbi:MAG: hypothetical protein EXS48_03445 [Candidatus Staskawiczbacteria bacterium]|nr:hypothetical protein [Candidatus Staskawiczbacteria bacterium]